MKIPGRSKGEFSARCTVVSTHRSYSVLLIRINKPGGCARITKIHYAVDGINVESIDVKYVLGGGYEKEIDPAIVSPFETLDRGGRKRRGRDFFMERADDVVKKVKQAIRKKASDAAAARTTTTHPRKTTDPDQSTSPSTPVTPEHPSMKVAKVPKVDLLAVPSYVIADRAIEVSPLPLDRAVVEQHGKETVVRRGLFGSTDNATKAKQPEKEKQSKLDKPPEDLAFHETSRDISQAHAAAVKRSLSAKCGRNYASKLATKRAAPVEDKPIDAKKAPTKTHLKDVFDYELRKAKEFLDEVCRAPCAREDDVDTSSKENRLNTSACNSLDEQKPAAV